jgi:hypothetical protein
MTNGYHTPPRKRGARAAGVDPRPGEDKDRGGHKTPLTDPDGMKPSEPIDGRQKVTEKDQPIRGKELVDGESARRTG